MRTIGRKRPERCVLLLWSIPLLSCTPEQNNRLMHFFFEFSEPQATSTEIPQTSPESVATADDETDHAPLPEPAHPFAHPGYRQGRCGNCHVKGRPELIAGSFDAACVKCHEDVFQQGPVLHGPVAVSECSPCHTPHQSDHKGLLILAVNRLCLTCHIQASVEVAPSHRNNMARVCTECHVPHAGSTRFLIKEPQPTSDASP